MACALSPTSFLAMHTMLDKYFLFACAKSTIKEKLTVTRKALAKASEEECFIHLVSTIFCLFELIHHTDALGLDSTVQVTSS